MTDLWDRIRAFLATQVHCVLSTAHADGSPQSALVAFSERDDLSIVVGTFDDTRKFANMTRDPRVSIVVSSENRALQVEGRARPVEGDEKERAIADRKSKNPASDKYARDPKQRYFVVEPSWMRFIDRDAAGERIVEELRF